MYTYFNLPCNSNISSNLYGLISIYIQYIQWETVHREWYRCTVYNTSSSISIENGDVAIHFLYIILHCKMTILLRGFQFSWSIWVGLHHLGEYCAFQPFFFVLLLQPKHYISLCISLCVFYLIYISNKLTYIYIYTYQYIL